MTPLSSSAPSTGGDADVGPSASASASSSSFAAGRGRVVRLDDLLGSGREMTILHGEAAYTLRLTANNKLILTK